MVISSPCHRFRGDIVTAEIGPGRFDPRDTFGQDRAAMVFSSWLTARRIRGAVLAAATSYQRLFKA
jgi:hypothetical protein